ncbi:MAG: Lrp/AsnC family transcriptional regulator [Candidatus Heimdallarchaeota archaeon]
MVFVLVNSKQEAEETVQAALTAIDGVQEIYSVTGAYNSIAKVIAPSMDLIKTTILEQIRAIPAVRSTLTMVVAESGA